MDSLKCALTIAKPKRHLEKVYFGPTQVAPNLQLGITSIDRSGCENVDLSCKKLAPSVKIL